MTIIIDKLPNNKRIKLRKLISNWSAVRLLPNTIKTGRARGIVTIAPKTEPLFKLRELPRANKFKNMYELIRAKGKIDMLKLKFPVVP